MKVVDLSCNNCGAGIEVPLKAKFVTCKFCNTRLRIQHTETSAFTEVALEMAQDIKQIKRDTSITRLDQEWMMRRESFQSRNKDGSHSMPSRGGAAVFLVVGLLMGLFVTTQFGAFGLIFIAFALLGGGAGLARAEKYEKERSSYERRRRELIRD